MSKQILVNFSHYETRVATLENGEIRSLHIEREEDKNVVGNIYLGVVKRVLPGMQAAFLELGLERTAFLYVDDIIDQPFGGDVDLLDDEDSESESPVELGADDDGEPLKESYDEEVAEESTRQTWEREVSEVSSEGPQTVQAKSVEVVQETGEEPEEFFERSPEERAEELVDKGHSHDDEDEDEDLYESDEMGDEEENSIEEDEELQEAGANGDYEEDGEFDESHHVEELAENHDRSEATEGGKSDLQSPPQNKIVAKEELPTELKTENRTEGQTDNNPETREVRVRQENIESESFRESEEDNVGNRIDRPRENRDGGRSRSGNWGRGGARGGAGAGGGRGTAAAAAICIEPATAPARRGACEP